MAKVYQDTRARKRGGVRPWIIAYVGLDGKRHRERTTATTKEEARSILRQKLSAITKANITGVHSLEALKPHAFEDFVRGEHLPHCKATHTASTYARDADLARAVLPYFAKMTLRAVTPGDVQRFVDQRAGALSRYGKPLRPASVNRELMFVSGAMAEAVKRGYVERNPVTGISQLPEHNDKLRWLTEQEEARMMALCPEFLRPIVMTALHTGARRGEVLGLKWSDVDFEQRLIRWTMTKNHRTRYVPINDVLDGLLRSIPPYVGADGPSPHVFTNPETGTRYRDVTHAFKRACRQAGLADVSFHTLRHTFASRLAQAGVSVKAIQELLGHGSLQVTMRYAHLAPNDLRRAVDVLATGRFEVESGTSTAQIRAAIGTPS